MFSTTEYKLYQANICLLKKKIQQRTKILSTDSKIRSFYYGPSKFMIYMYRACSYFQNIMHLSMLSRQGRGGGRAWGGDLTFLKNLPSNFLPTGKSFQSNATKFPLPGLHIAVKYPKAGPNKGTIEISPNKTLQSLFMNIVASPKIHVPVTAAVIRYPAHLFSANL